MNFDAAFSRFMPTEPTRQQSAQSTRRVVAKMDHTNPKQCPYCKKELESTECCGTEVYICHDDRAVFPIPD